MSHLARISSASMTQKDTSLSIYISMVSLSCIVSTPLTPLLLSEPHNYSIRCLSANTELSIVALTGIDGHAYNSWRGRGDLRLMWLRHFLSNDLPQCRTMIYGYDAKLTSRSVARIRDYSLGLLDDLKRVRHGEVGLCVETKSGTHVFRH